MDLALAIEKIYLDAQYFGSTAENTKDEFDNLNWQDERQKPTWKQVQDAWVKYEKDLAKDLEAKAATKQAILDRIGLTIEDLELLGLQQTSSR